MSENFFIYDKTSKNFFFIKKQEKKTYKKSLYIPSKLKKMENPEKNAFLRKLNQNFLFWFLKNKKIIKKKNSEDFKKVTTFFENNIINYSISIFLGISSYFALKQNLNHFLFIYPKPIYFKPINLFLAFSVFFGFSCKNYFDNDFYLNNLAFKYSRFFYDDVLDMEGNDDVNQFFRDFKY